MTVEPIGVSTLTVAENDGWAYPPPAIGARVQLTTSASTLTSAQPVAPVGTAPLATLKLMVGVTGEVPVLYSHVDQYAVRPGAAPYEYA